MEPRDTRAHINELVRRLTKIEGKKRQLEAGNAREVLSALRDVCKDPEGAHLLMRYLFIKRS